MHEQVLHQLQVLRGLAVNGGLTIAELELKLRALRKDIARECSEQESAEVRILVDSFWCAMEQEVA